MEAGVTFRHCVSATVIFTKEIGIKLQAIGSFPEKAS